MEIHQKRTVEMLELRSLFSRWIALLALFARNRNARRRMHFKDYESLYSSLLYTCRIQVDQSKGEHRVFFQEMSSLVEPWMTLHSLESSKQSLLMNLLVQCREIEQILSGRKDIGLSLWRVAQFGLLMLVVCLVALSLSYVFNQQDGSSSSLVEIRMAYRRLVYFIRETTFLQQFAACTVVMLLVTIQFVRSSKKY